MTRETKIGLLVGLAFIIVIWILLSDHLTSSTEPPPATLANAGSNVMQALSTPGGAQVPSVTNPPQQQQSVTPHQPVPTSADLDPRPQPVQIVQIGPGSTSQHPAPISVQGQAADPRHATAPPVITMPQNTPAPAEPAPTVVASNNPVDDDSPIITQLPTNVDPSLAQTAQRNGEALVALDNSGRSAPPPTPAPANWNQVLSNAREHKAEPGDSVSRMASRFLGGNTQVNRDLIIRANPSLQKNPDRVIVGQTYLIPNVQPSSGAVAHGQPAPQPPQAQPTSSAPDTANTATASATEYWYTVKENDKLWTIAEQQLGDGNAWVAIKELNNLQDANKIYVGMKLKLPGRPVAQAN